MVLLAGAFTPLWILPHTFAKLSAGAFCVQFGIQGAWGVIPIQLAEMSPPAFRVTFSGVAYQFGSMISAASAQIETVGGQRWKTTVVKDGQTTIVPDYAKVQGLFIGIVAAFVVFITVVGPERHGSSFEGSNSFRRSFDKDNIGDKILTSVPRHVIVFNRHDGIELEKASIEHIG